MRGNPVSSRPESGVDNCYPGLEFDQRNLDRNFFPGLHFEFQRGDGAALASMRLDDEQKASGLTDEDSPPDRPLYIWYLYGRTDVRQHEPVLFDGNRKWGIDVWRQIHDLLPGRVAIVLGPAPGTQITLSPDDALVLLKRAYAAADPAERYVVEREPETRAIRYAVLSRDRAPYLDAEGVIDVASYAPGELTKTMCAPWIYDFRDCYCFYWASNKPDLVDSEDGKHRFVSFIRRDRSDTPPRDRLTWAGRIETELTVAQLLDGWWHKLPVVLGDRETAPVPIPAPSPPPPGSAPYLTRGQAIRELSYLAAVEHALMIEYLYAAYSIDAPRERAASPADDEAKRIFNVGFQLLEIAIDEMRHFLWANQLLRLFGAPPATGRAKRIAQPPRRGSGRKVYPGQKQYLDRPFALAPLSAETLDWFITVEAPSQSINEGLDGMYVELLRSVRGQPALFPDHERIVPMIKLLIDEGTAHHRRFMGIRDTLAGIAPDRYLRPLDRPPTPLQRHYLDLCDGYYQTILDAIEISFSLGEQAGGTLVRDAIRSMENLDDTARTLAAQGVGPRFRLSQRNKAARLSHDEALTLFEARAASHRRTVDAIAAKGSGDDRERAERHHVGGAHLFKRLRKTVASDAGRG